MDQHLTWEEPLEAQQLRVHAGVRAHEARHHRYGRLRSLKKV